MRLRRNEPLVAGCSMLLFRGWSGGFGRRQTQGPNRSGKTHRVAYPFLSFRFACLSRGHPAVPGLSFFSLSVPGGGLAKSCISRVGFAQSMLREMVSGLMAADSSHLTEMHSTTAKSCGVASFMQSRIAASLHLLQLSALASGVVPVSPML